MRYLVVLFICLMACSFQQPEAEGSQTKDQPSESAELIVKKKPRNIIFLIGDGMGLTQITAGMYASARKLALEKCKHIGLIKTHAADNLITDSAAGATAFSCGHKTYNGAIAVDMEKKPLKTILEMAIEQNFTTGLVVTSTIVHATPAAYYAHQPSRNMYEEIAVDLFNSGVDVAIGGGRKFFNDREDDQDLIFKFKEKGYTVAESYDAAKPIQGKFVGFTGEDAPIKDSEGRGDYLKEASVKTAEYLSTTDQPFFMMIEGSQIDWGGHANSSAYIISEMIDFDETIGAILEFAENDGETLVVITADHETGGYAINGGSYEDKEIEAAFTTGYHTGTMVPVFAFGPGSEAFNGIYDNTAIFDKMASLLNLK